MADNDQAIRSDDWEEQDWEPLLYRIDDDRCIPFLGAGANAGILPLGGELAADLAKKYGYPLPDTNNLEHVSQYVALRHGREHVKEEVVRILAQRCDGDKITRGCHRLLAHLPVSLYMTTNYDMLMEDALAQDRDPQSVVCPWNSIGLGGENIPEAFIPKPIIFHLHGSVSDATSLVLTEDDYLEFLTRMTEASELIPRNFRDAITDRVILFIGYRLADWNFRILFQQLSRFRDVRSIAVFPTPSSGDPAKDKVEKYLEVYFGAIKVKIFWGTATDFAAQLTSRYAEKFGRDALIAY